MPQQLAKNGLGYGLLVIRDRQPTFGDMKDPLGRAAIALRIVQDPLSDAIRGDDLGGILVPVGWQREGPGQAVAVEHEGAHRHARDVGAILQIIVEEILDPLVSRAEMIGKEPVLFAIERDHVAHEFGEIGVGLERKRRAAEVPELEIDIEQEFVLRLGRTGAAKAGSLLLVGGKGCVHAQEKDAGA